MRKKVGERVSTKLFCATSRCGYKGFHGTAARRLLARGACVVGRKVAALPPISLSFTPSGLALQDDPLQAWLSGTTVARRVGRKHIESVLWVQSLQRNKLDGLRLSHRSKVGRLSWIQGETAAAAELRPTWRNVWPRPHEIVHRWQCDVWPG